MASRVCSGDDGQGYVGWNDLYDDCMWHSRTCNFYLGLIIFIH